MPKQDETTIAKKRMNPLERLQNIKEDCFLSSAVVTVNKDKSVKIAFNDRKLNSSCIKKRLQS